MNSQQINQSQLHYSFPSKIYKNGRSKGLKRKSSSLPPFYLTWRSKFIFLDYLLRVQVARY